MKNISFIGSGNVAWNMAHAFHANDVGISSISSRNYESAQKLATAVDSATCEIEDIDSSSQLVIIAVKDDQIKNVLARIPRTINSVVHTSGSVGLDVFEDRFRNYGVFYPLQSFSKDRKADFSKIPFILEANSQEFAEDIRSFASVISDKQSFMRSEDRKKLHLSAVFANNFVNFMAMKAYEILDNENIDPELIKPLLQETVQRLDVGDPKQFMSGPAKRGDLDVVKKQMELLKYDPKLQSLYAQISSLISEEFNGTEL